MGESIVAGDTILGLPSSGLHTNGYSLARKIFGETASALNKHYPELSGTIGEALLEPHRCYYHLLKPLLPDIKGLAHITGGGITDNLPRSIPQGLGAEIDLSAWEAPPVFAFLHRAGNIADLEMLRTFNMGLGYFIIVSEAEAEKAMDAISQTGERAARAGRVVAGENAVQYVGKMRYAE